PFYYASEEQYRWLQIIAQKVDPNADLNDICHLKQIAALLDESEIIKREPGMDGCDDDVSGHGPAHPINAEYEEGMEGVVDGVGTLMLDHLGRQSMLRHTSSDLEYVGESASVVFHRKVRDYVHAQRPEIQLIERLPSTRHLLERADLVNAEERSDAIVETPGGFGSPQSVFSIYTTSVRSRLPPRHLADPLV